MEYETIFNYLMKAQSLKRRLVIFDADIIEHFLISSI